MSASAILSRSDTSWRASQMSISSLKTTVTALTAVRLIERISVQPGQAVHGHLDGERQVLLDLRPATGPASW